MPNPEPSPPPSGIRDAASEVPKLPFAWQPFTPRGVSAFAHAGIGRLLLVQLIVAAMAAGAIGWFLSTAWFPVIHEAIRQLPETGVLQNGQLLSPRTSAEPLKESRFLAIVVDLDGRSGAGVPTDLLVKFRRIDFAICSLFGCLNQPYATHWRIPFSRLELEASWGAWEPMLYALACAAVIAGLFVNWVVLATLGCPVVRLYAFFKDRRITVAGSWKLASAALLPGALLATTLIVLYGWGVIDLIRFLVGWGLHLLMAPVYWFVAPLRLPRVDALPTAATNPFSPPEPT